MPVNIKNNLFNNKKFPFYIGDTYGVAESFRTLHWHKEMEICYIKKGTGKYLINGNEYSFAAGDIFIISNDEIHLCFDDKDLVIQVTQFDPSLIWSNGTYLMDYEYLKPFLETESNFCNKLDFNNEYSNLYISTLMDMEKEFNEKREGYELVIKALLLKLLSFIIRYSNLNGEKTQKEFISPAITQKIKNVFIYVEEFYHKPLNITELAGIAQMSVPYFCAMFKTLSGIPPMDYVIHKRISAAKQQLKNTEKKILDIAEECGFNSLSNFNHTFKAYLGVSPSHYRKS